MSNAPSTDILSDDERSTVVVAFIDQAIEHHAAILLLMRSGLVGSAFALTRSITEILVRGVWLTVCATDEQVMKFVKQDKIDPTFAQMSEAIDKTCGVDFFADLKIKTWSALNSYTHTGMLQVGRRFAGDALLPVLHRCRENRSVACHHVVHLDARRDRFLPDKDISIPRKKLTD